VAWHGEGSKAFFSEEKKQKTFARSGVCAAWQSRERNRCLLQKRASSLT
jgi:hypothetical protein